MNASAYDPNVQVSNKAFATEDSSDEDTAPQEEEEECFTCGQEEVPGQVQKGQDGWRMEEDGE